MISAIKDKAVDVVARAIGHHVLFPPKLEAMSKEELKQHVEDIAREAVVALMKASPMTPSPAARAEALEPCPFCDGEAEVLHLEDGENAGGSCVSCKRCLASSNVEFGFKENFVSNWNRRPALDAQARLIEEAREVVLFLANAAASYSNAATNTGAGHAGGRAERNTGIHASLTQDTTKPSG